jgi:Secretion system C-terminal sorting domain
MKKLLLSLLLIAGFAANSQQVFWEEKSTGFLNGATGAANISYADANTAWFYAVDGSGSGDLYQQWARTTDGGETWTIGDIILPSAEYQVGGIHAISATKCYISVHAAGLVTIQGGIWVTEDAGVTWTKQITASYNTGSDSFANFVHFFDAQNGVTMGDPASNYFEIYTTSNGGTNWVRVPSANIPAPLTGEYGYTNIYETFGDNLWLGTNKGRMLRSSDKGLTWTASVTPTADFGTGTRGSYDFSSATNGLLVLNNHNMYTTTNAGATWLPATPVGKIRNFEIAYVPGTANTYVTIGQAKAIPASTARGSAISTDGGLNWFDINDVDVLANDGAGALSFFDVSHGLGGGFTADEVTGGVWKWIANAAIIDQYLANESYTKTKYFTASPNPTSGVLNIAGTKIASVSVTDVLGKEIANTNYSSLDSVSLDLTSYNAGVYMVKVTNVEGNTSTMKVVRQ